ncbi:MAG: hypothetical protein AAF394_04110, partial [Planctomycetota bacterium]
KKTGEVWVFLNEAWTGVIQLAGDVARALESDELHQAIALEAENYSGISAFDSHLGMHVLPNDANGGARWWVTQVPQSDWQEVEQVVRKFGGKLTGMGHPALAAFPTDQNASGTHVDGHPWRLIQAFGESTISVEGRGNDIQDVLTFGDLKTQRTRSQLGEWCEEEESKSLAWVTDQPLPELLVDPECKQILLSGETNSGTADADESSRGCIGGESALRSWAETIARTLRASGTAKRPVPVVVAKKPPMSSQAATWIACGLGLLVAIGCFALHSSTSQQIADLDVNIGTLNQTKKSLSLDKQALQKLEKEFQQQQKSLATLKESHEDLSQSLSKASRMRHLQKTRWFELVAAIARANEGDCWVKGLETHGKVVIVKGLAVTNRDVSSFATNLEEFASPHGWRVHPAQTGRNEIALIEFEVSLDVSDQEVVIPGVSSALAGPAVTHSFTSTRSSSVGNSPDTRSAQSEDNQR